MPLRVVDFHGGPSWRTLAFDYCQVTFLRVSMFLLTTVSLVEEIGSTLESRIEFEDT